MTTVPPVGGKQYLERYGGFGCGCMALTLPLIEADMIAAGERFTFAQMCYHPGVAASAGTHDLGGVADALQWSDTALKIWTKWGCFPNHRLTPQFPIEHNHVLWVGCKHQAPLAAEQVRGALANGWNGLGVYGKHGGAERYGVYEWVPKLTWQQAYVKYAPKTQEGMLGMTGPIGPLPGPGKKITLRNGADTWLPVKADGGVSILGNATKSVVARALVEVGNLQPGEWVDVRFAAVAWPHDRHLRVCRKVPVNASAGGRQEVTFIGSVPGVNKGEAPRLRILVTAQAAAATIQLLELDGIYA